MFVEDDIWKLGGSDSPLPPKKKKAVAMPREKGRREALGVTTPLQSISVSQGMRTAASMESRFLSQPVKAFRCDDQEY